MELWTLFVTASIPVLESFLITALGSYLALDRVNLLGQDSRKHLNTIVFYVFTPALIGTNLAETITFESMVKFKQERLEFLYDTGLAVGHPNGFDNLKEAFTKAEEPPSSSAAATAKGIIHMVRILQKS